AFRRRHALDVRARRAQAGANDVGGAAVPVRHGRGGGRQPERLSWILPATRMLLVTAQTSVATIAAAIATASRGCFVRSLTIAQTSVALSAVLTTASVPGLSAKGLSSGLSSRARVERLRS